VNSVCKIVGIAIANVAALATLGTGTSAAKDQFVGSTYADASAKISEKGYTAVISTVVGDQLKTDDCIVTSSRRATFAPTDNFDHSKEYLLALNCSAALAHNGQPGNSLATPQGREEKKVLEKAAKYNDNPETCVANFDLCKKFCDYHEGKCSSEVMGLF